MMDRLFVLQESYIEGRHNFEGQLISFAMADLIARNLDSYCIVRDNCTNVNILKSHVENSVISKKKIIPIGTVEFVQEWLDDKKMKPIEIPFILRKYLKRTYEIKSGNKLLETDYDPKSYFIKDIDTLKNFNSQLCLTPLQVKEHINPDVNYSISEFVEFNSEWRIFVYKDEVMGCECYSGEPIYFPDKYTIKNMVADYSTVKHPDAYTLDVGVRWIVNNNNEPFSPPSDEATEPMEIHPFVAVGLYGFYDRKLLDMFEAGYDWYKGD